MLRKAGVRYRYVPKPRIRGFQTVWKSTSELGYHRVDAATGTTLRRWRGNSTPSSRRAHGDTSRRTRPRGARPSLPTQAEDQAENTADGILGERRLKEEFIRSYKPTATVLEGKPYPVFQEVQEKRILSATVNSGLLQSLDNLGLGLGDVEKLLPFLDKFGLIGLVRKNLPLAIIATGYLLIEPAPFLLPVLGALLAIPTAAWTAVAAVTTGAEIYLNAFASFEDAGLVSLLLAPLLLIAGVLSLVPTAIGAIKSLPPV